MELIRRKTYMAKLVAFKDKDVVKVVTGVRRCGKSVLLQMFQDYLRDEGVSDKRIVSLNLEEYESRELHNPDTLYVYVKERLVPGEMTYVFIDEIQYCENFPAVIDGLYVKKNVDIYVTGSNAFMQSHDIATMLSGRYVEIPMLPLSFKEYCEATESAPGTLSEKYSHYLQRSSFPYALVFGEKRNDIYTYLEGLYNTIIVKDIATRLNINDVMVLESVVRFIFDNIGSRVSSKKIADTLTSQGRKTTSKTVERYIYGLCESFIIYEAKRYNIRGKQHLKTLEKYYVVDIGLRYFLLGTASGDVGHILENVVYLELIRRGYEVYVGKLDDLEVDFVVRNHTGMAYVQVAATVREASTLDRELKPLQHIADSYPKILLTLDDDPEANYDGIRRVNALQWLIGKSDIFPQT